MAIRGSGHVGGGDAITTAHQTQWPGDLSLDAMDLVGDYAVDYQDWEKCATACWRDSVPMGLETGDPKTQSRRE